MMINDDLMRQLQEVFAAEAQEHLQRINTHVLSLEQQPDAEATSPLLDEIFREAHTLKGAARSVDLESVEAISHQLETLFSRLQSRALQPRAELFDVVYQALDAIGMLVRESSDGAAADVDVSALCMRLEQLGEQPIASHAPLAAAHTLSTSKQPGRSRRQRRPHASQEAPVPPASALGSPPPAQPAEPGQRPPDETVRIATAKLDALMAQVGELQVTRIGVEQHLVDVRTLEVHMEAWEARWRKLRPHYRQLRQACAEPSAHAEMSASASGNAPSASQLIGRRELEAMLAFLETNESQLRTARAELEELRHTVEGNSRRLTQVVADLQDDVRRTRMLPVSSVFDTFPRMVRDLARERGKDVRIIIQGGETEVDRSMLEQIKAPVMHLLRNCVDHGIEPADMRRAAGKPGVGTIRLVAAQRADCIVIDVADDGAGIDLDLVRASSVRQGLLSAEAAEAISDHEALWLIFRSGLSTSPTITDISGRGVGMDVVREHIERLNGMINVESQSGQGTHFSLTLPLTVATTLCLLVRVSSQIMALPITNVVRLLRLAPADIGRTEGHQGIHVDGRPILLTHLADALEMEAARSSNGAASLHPAIILGTAEKRVAFVVDAFVGAQEVVIKRLPQPLNHVRQTAGATILGSGKVVMILNVADLVRSAGHVAARPTRVEEPRRAMHETTRILVADDSITTRTMEKNILEAAGYVVQAVADGLEAWNILQSHPIDLLVSDVNMPRLDGFDLAAKVRADKRLKDLPIILVTALNSDADRARGVAAGADAYVVKGAFDQDVLLAAIRRYI